MMGGKIRSCSQTIPLVHYRGVIFSSCFCRFIPCPPCMCIHSVLTCKLIRRSAVRDARPAVSRCTMLTVFTLLSTYFLFFNYTGMKGGRAPTVTLNLRVTYYRIRSLHRIKWFGCMLCMLAHRLPFRAPLVPDEHDCLEPYVSQLLTWAIGIKNSCSLLLSDFLRNEWMFVRDAQR